MAPRKTSRAKNPITHDASLELVSDKRLRIVVVADTHSHPHPKIAHHVRELSPDAILHAGDIGDLKVLDDLRALAPLIAVRGNVDEAGSDLPEIVNVDIREEGESAFRLLLTHIAVYGPKIRAEVARAAHATGARLIVCGHSHVPFIGRDKGLTVFNPGSIGPRRLHLPIVFGVLEIAEGRLSLRHVDCESGRAWSP